MAGVSSLGVGSGVLTADVIDQLKEADEARVIKPLENKYELNKQKQDSFELLSSLMTTFKSSASALSYDTIFDTKSVDITGDAEVSIDAGATIESFTLETVQLAKKEITEFSGFSSENATIADSATNGGTFQITVGTGSPIEIDYDDTTTLSQLAQAITDESNGTVSASILQTGDSAYSLVLTSGETGANQALTFSNTGDAMNTNFSAYDAATNPTGYKEIQAAEDAIFKYNGIEATRSTNEIDDLILGVTMTLKKEGDFSSVDVAMDTENLVGEMQLFVDNYNALIQNLNDMTEKNEETGAEGVFNSESFIKNIRRDLNNVITQLDGSNNSLMQYGLALDRSGTMSFDKSALTTKLEEDESAVKLFFTGGTDSNGNDVTGIFEKIDEKVKSYTGFGKQFSSFETSLKNDGESILETLTRNQDSLNTRYEIMTKRFTAYDAIISKINAQFSSLQMMINAEISSDS